MLLLLCALLGGPDRELRMTTPPGDSLTVYLFLLEDCKITQAYTDRLGELCREFAGPGMGFIGLFPNPVSDEATIDAFATRYGLPFPCTLEGAMARARDFRVRVTPEVVVYDERARAVRYQGRIDDLFVRVGKRRRVVGSHDLRDALLALKEGRPLERQRTPAVGCLLPGE